LAVLSATHSQRFHVVIFVPQARFTINGSPRVDINVNSVRYVPAIEDKSGSSLLKNPKPVRNPTKFARLKRQDEYRIPKSRRRIEPQFQQKKSWLTFLHRMPSQEAKVQPGNPMQRLYTKESA